MLVGLPAITYYQTQTRGNGFGFRVTTVYDFWGGSLSAIHPWSHTRPHENGKPWRTTERVKLIEAVLSRVDESDRIMRISRNGEDKHYRYVIVEELNANKEWEYVDPEDLRAILNAKRGI